MNKCFKSVLSIVLICIMVINLLPLYSYASESDNSEFLLGNGTVEKPYEIYDYDDFQKINDNPNAVYKLCGNINMSKSGIWQSINIFRGVLDGNGYSIYGIKEYASNISGAATGIFSTVNGATIKNLFINLDNETEEYVHSKYSGGIIVGYANNSTISGCCATGNLWCDEQWPNDCYGNYLGGIAGCIKNTTIDQCKFIGNLKGYNQNDCANNRIVGGIVGRTNGDSKTVQIISNCYVAGNMYAEIGWCYQTGFVWVGGIAGDAGYSSASTNKIINCLSEANCDNKVPCWYAGSKSIWPDYYGCNVSEIGGIEATNFAKFTNCFYSLSKQQVALSVNKKDVGIDDEALVSRETYVGWDFDNIWAINSDENGGIPYLRNVIAGNLEESSTYYRQFEYVSNISNGDNRVSIDKTLTFTFEDWADIENYHDIYVSTKGGKKVSILLHKSGQTIYIKPIDIWTPNTKYIVTIPEDSFKIIDKEIYNSRAIFEFTTNYLSESNDLYKVDDSCITQQYANKYVLCGQDKSLPAIPSNKTDEYVKEFRKWAEGFGYNDYVTTLSDEEIEKILNIEYGQLVELSDNSIAKETGTKKTVMDCMRDLIMIQNMQSFLIEIENNFKEECSLEKMNSSVEELKRCYLRYLEYMESNSSNTDAIKVAASLLDYALLFDVLGKEKKDNIYFEEFYNVKDDTIVTPRELGNYVLNIMNISIDYSDSDLVKHSANSFDLNLSSEQLKNSRKLLSNVKKYGHLVWDINENNKNIGDLTKEIVKDINIREKIVKMVGINTSSDTWKCISSVFDEVKNLHKYMVSGRSFLVGMEAVKIYYKAAASYYNYIEEQYPSWLFMSVYYMANADPETYKQVWGNKDDFVLEYGQAYIESSDYTNEQDSIVKLLKGAMLDNGSAFNLYTYQDAYVESHNIWGTVDIAGDLSEMRRTNTNSCASTLVTYALNQYIKKNHRTTYCKIACPTDVQIIDDSTGEVVQTITNNMAISNNVGVFGSFYLGGENLDQKIVILNEGYSLQVIPTAKGEMDCSFFVNIGEKTEYENLYEQVDIDVGELYKYKPSDETLYLIEDGNESEVMPSNATESNNSSEQNQEDNSQQSDDNQQEEDSQCLDGEQQRDNSQSSDGEQQENNYSIDDSASDDSSNNTQNNVSSGQYIIAKVYKTGEKSLSLSWKKIKGSDGYIIYGNACGKNKNKQIVRLSSSKTSYTIKNLKSGKYYKYMVVAYKNIGGVKTNIAKSKVIYATTKGGKYGNAKAIYAIKNGKKINLIKLKCGKKEKINLFVKKDKKIKIYRRNIFESDNPTVASVSSKGVIKAKAKGVCNIYIYAQNGISYKITVKVK